MNLSNFINTHRRTLQPILETSNSTLITTEKRKRYDSTFDENYHSRHISYANHYWPSNLVQSDIKKN